MQVFHFRQDDETSNTTSTVRLDDEATWMAAVNAFANFLSAIYGFDIKNNIIVNVGGEYVTLRQQMLDEAIAEEF